MSTPAGLLPFSFFKGRIVDSNDARVSISSHSLQYGSTCFGGLRGYRRGNAVHLFRLRDHHRRLMDGCKILGFNCDIEFEVFEEIIATLIQKNQPSSDIYIRPFVVTDDQLVAPRFDTLDFDLAIYMLPMGQYHDQSKGLRLMVSSWRKFSDTAIPTKAKAGGCYLNSSLAATEARRAGYDDALLLDQAGYVTEASVANILLVLRGEVIIPQVGSAVLDGITMRTVTEFLRSESIPVRCEQIDRSMVYAADELLLTGTAAQILYAESLDGREIGNSAAGPGPFCQMIRAHFENLIEGRHAQSREWITQIPINKRSASCKGSNRRSSPSRGRTSIRT